MRVHKRFFRTSPFKSFSEEYFHRRYNSKQPLDSAAVESDRWARLREPFPRKRPVAVLNSTRKGELSEPGTCAGAIKQEWFIVCAVVRETMGPETGKTTPIVLSESRCGPKSSRSLKSVFNSRRALRAPGSGSDMHICVYVEF